MVSFEFDPRNLETLVTAIVARLTERLMGSTLLINGKIGLTEREAAKLLSLNPWQLAHERKAGKIDHVRTVGNRILYTGEHIKEYIKLHTQRGN